MTREANPLALLWDIKRRIEKLAENLEGVGLDGAARFLHGCTDDLLIVIHYLEKLAENTS